MVLFIEPLLCLGLFFCADKEPPTPPPTPKAAKCKITIGKDTTVATGPLTKDGYVDFEAALNERLGKGVTPQTNAVVLLWKCFGPHPEGATMPEEFFKLIGIAQPPEQGDYLVTLNRYMKDTLKLESGPAMDEFLEQYDRAIKRPWTANEYPALAGWLAVNDKPLAVAIEASKRPQYFSPLTTRRTENGGSGLIGALLPAVQKCRELASALTMRAMLRTAAGNAAGAWQDLQACHRLGRLVGHGGTLIEALVGIAIDMIASNGDMTFLERSKPTAKQIEGYLADLRNLPPLFELADKVDLTERFTFLECVVMMDRHGVKYLQGLANGPPGENNPFAGVNFDGIDWDATLKNANQWYDRMVNAMREKDRTARSKKLDEIEADLKASKKRLTDSGQVDKKLAGNAKERGQVMGDILIGLLLPAVGKVQNAGDRSHQVQANLAVAFALEWYQREQGRYPEKLEALTPKYLAKIPQDVFAGKPLTYRAAGKGYQFYSVGVNGKDEEGRGYDDDPRGDDLGFRMPLPELKKKP